MCSSCGPRKEGLTFADFLPFSDQMTLCHISMFLSIILTNMLHLHYNFNNMYPFLLGNNSLDIIPSWTLDHLGIKCSHLSLIFFFLFYNFYASDFDDHLYAKNSLIYILSPYLPVQFRPVYPTAFSISPIWILPYSQNIQN